MSVVAMPTRRKAYLACLAVTALVGALPQMATGEENQIKVDWSDPEIAAFVEERAANPPRSLGQVADDKLSKVQLPVLGFTSTPGVVEKTFRLGPKPATQRDVVVDEKNPVWYQIVENYGDMTVSIEADLRIQHKFPATYPLYRTTPEGAAPTTPEGAAPKAGPEISVYDEQNEEGEEAITATYTIYKFGIPYTVTIECSLEAKDQCRDTGQIAADSDLVKLIRANPPSP